MPKTTSAASSYAMKVRRPDLNFFNRSHYIQGTTNFGWMHVVKVWDVTSGSLDKINYDCLFRMLPLTAPAIQDIYADFYTFYCRKDILWRNWRSFKVGGESGVVNPATASLPRTEFTAVGGAASDAIASYMGPGSLSHELGFRTRAYSQPLGASAPLFPVSGRSAVIGALRAMMYQKVWYEYFRDANNDLAPDVSSAGYFGENRMLGDGVEQFNDPDTDIVNAFQAQLWTRRSACWHHDYFTDALPNAQRGQPILIPTGAGADIDDLTRATRLQRLAQLENRIGGRYREFLRAEYGVIADDDSLNIPQFVSHHRELLPIGEILQTSGSDITGSTTPLGDLGGHSMSMCNSGPATFSADHDGIFMTIMVIRPGNMYLNSMDRELLKTSRFDMGLPDLAQIGDQILDLRELCADACWSSNGASAIGTLPLGYQAPYEEYRQQTGYALGEINTTLANWSAGRSYRFGSPGPAVDGGLDTDYIAGLSSTFNKVAPSGANQSDAPQASLYRIFADTNPNDDHFVYELFAHHSAGRPLPAYSDPSFDFFR